MKKRIFTISLIVASLVLLVSVGFAGWVITQKQEGEATGNFSAEGATTVGTLTVTAGKMGGSDFVSGTPTIVFGYAADPAAPSNPWLTYDSSVAAAALKAYIKIEYTKGTAAYPASGEKFNVTHLFLKSGSSSSVDSKLIGGPSISRYATGSDATTVADYSAGVVTFYGNGTIILEVAYSFGTALSDSTYPNPYTYFNHQDRNAAIGSAIDFEGTEYDILTTDKWSAAATKALNALDAAVENLTFKVTVVQQ